MTNKKLWAVISVLSVVSTVLFILCALLIWFNLNYDAQNMRYEKYNKCLKAELSKYDGVYDPRLCLQKIW